MTEHERKLKVRCYYTDYVTHMIRFYLSTPDTLRMDGKRKADIENWIAVQDVWRKIKDDDKQMLMEIYKAHYKLQEGVRIYSEKSGADLHDIWVLITKTYSAIAKRRGLV